MVQVVGSTRACLLSHLHSSNQIRSLDCRVTLTLFSQLVLFQQHPDHDQCPDIEVQHSDHFIFTHGHISFFLSFFFSRCPFRQVTSPFCLASTVGPFSQSFPCWMLKQEQHLEGSCQGKRCCGYGYQTWFSKSSTRLFFFKGESWAARCVDGSGAGCSPPFWMVVLVQREGVLFFFSCFLLGDENYW
jgi:hypothetical protein